MAIFTGMYVEWICAYRDDVPQGDTH